MSKLVEMFSNYDPISLRSALLCYWWANAGCFQKHRQCGCAHRQPSPRRIHAGDGVESLNRCVPTSHKLQAKHIEFEGPPDVSKKTLMQLENSSFEGFKLTNASQFLCAGGDHWWPLLLAPGQLGGGVQPGTDCPAQEAMKPDQTCAGCLPAMGHYPAKQSSYGCTRCCI
ncbi:hypothetical protein CEXT_352791 [Caerostris extrusa]|uniref:Uncharacterized protein n=1 Tax=Caerostris extrusa TaxID=172846 RepID=A0AAV4M9Z2_CAEEX|nr:hypothetical protein CEXT_352791 [Caerostris extrusa]